MTEKRAAAVVDDKADEFMTTRQLAAMLNVTEMTVYRLASRGELPAYSIGRAKRFRRDEIQEWLKRRRTVVRE